MGLTLLVESQSSAEEGGNVRGVLETIRAHQARKGPTCEAVTRFSYWPLRICKVETILDVL